MDTRTIEKMLRDRMAECTESVSAEFHDAVRPIYGSTERGTPEHLGTCFLLELRADRYMVTASHVIDHNELATLYVAGTNDLVMIQGDFLATRKPREEDHYDFAFWKLNAKFVDELGSVKFFKEADIAKQRPPIKGRLYMALGYPCSKNRKLDVANKSVRPTIFPYTGTAKDDPSLAKLLKVSGPDHVFL
jgi:hypothetical protein